MRLRLILCSSAKDTSTTSSHYHPYEMHRLDPTGTIELVSGDSPSWELFI